jgi:hypothetical protein
VKLGIVIPCHNEDEVLPETSGRITELLSRLAAKGKSSPESLVYLVDDGLRWNLGAHREARCA